MITTAHYNKPKEGVFIENEIKEYKEYIKMQAADPDVDKKALAEQLLVRIGFYQHERLIHLIVTMSFAIFFCCR